MGSSGSTAGTSGAPREAYFEGLVEMAEGRWEPNREELSAFVEHDNIYG